VSPADSLFERILARRDAGRARRAQALPIVKGAETIKELTPLGLLEWYLHPDIPGQLIRSILSYVLEIPPGSRSGRLQHQGGIVHMVLQGEGWTLLDGTRHDWRERSCIALPARPNGIIYQHFNASDTIAARLLVALPNVLEPLDVDMGAGFEVLEPAPEYRQLKAKAIANG